MKFKAKVSLLTLPAMAFMAGCATPAKVANMVPQDYSLAAKHPQSVHVDIYGGEETNPMLASKISDHDFKDALVLAIQKSKAFSSVVEIDGADYRLEVSIANLSQPMAGIDMTVTLSSFWKLTKVGATEPVWDDTVYSTYTAKFGDALVGITRLRLATEGAGRENIKEGLRLVSELELP